MADKKKTTQASRIAPNYRQFQGEVVRAATPKTIHVVVKTVKMHSKYRKQYHVSHTYAVHDEIGRAKVGDLVQFVECRPMSRTKRWRLVAVTTAKQA